MFDSAALSCRRIVPRAPGIALSLACSKRIDDNIYRHALSVVRIYKAGPDDRITADDKCGWNRQCPSVIALIGSNVPASAGHPLLHLEPDEDRKIERKQLEDEFGHDLFRRERNLTHLTEFGRRMTPFLQQCFDSAAAAKTLASSLKKGVVSPLTLANSRSLSLSLIVSQLTELSRAFDGLELRLLRGASGDINEHLKKGEADVALAGPLGESWDR